MKKIIALMTAVVMTCSVTLTAMAYTFSDVTPQSSYAWALDSVEDLVSKKIIASDTNFNPSQSLTNQQILAFMGRILGINEDENAKVVAFALEKYNSFLSGYTTYANKEAALLMYKGLYTQSDIKAMLDSKDTVVSRYQAAIYITKLMGGEEDVKNKVLISLDYADTDSIPTTAQGYVEYMKEQNIMLGDNMNNFSPNTTLNRAMMAVILSKVYTKVDRQYTMSKISEVNTAANTVVTLDTDGSAVNNTLTNDTKILINGEKKTVSDLKAGQTITFTTSGNKIVEADVIASTSTTTTVDVAYSSKAEDKGTTFIKTYAIGGAVTSVTSYKLASDVTITYSGKTSTLSAIGVGDALHLEIQDGTVTLIQATPKTSTIDVAIVTALSYEKSTITISSSNSAYNGKTFDVSPTAVVYKNNSIVAMSDIAVGDTVSLVLTYGTVTKLTSTAKEGTIKGTIKEMVISGAPSITVTVGDETKKYDLSNAVSVTIEDKPSDIYSLRVGYLVTITAVGQEVSKIAVESTSTVTSITGVIQSVNPTYNFIKLVNSTTGETEDVFTTGATKIMDTTLGTTYKLSQLKEGQTIHVFGNAKSGSFVATSIIVDNQ